MARPAARTFGSLLREYRRAAGLTQEELAERANTAPRTISDWERELRHPRKDALQFLEDALELSPTQRELFTKLRRHPSTPKEPERIESSWPESDARRHGLPSPPHRLIGREHELAAIQEILCRLESRLLTLLGVGGSGKTRLALAAADSLVDRFADGAFFVDLAPLRNPAHVIVTIAYALRVPETGQPSIREALLEALRTKHLLLVLDNFEHVAEAAGAITELLEGCPLLKILVTSRSRLRLRWERTFAVLPLGLPTTEQLAEPDSLLSCPSVALLVDRFQAILPSFRLTAENLDAVAGICRRLDGLPLALELAAARITILGPKALLDRLDRRLPLLPSRLRDLPERQRTMRTAIAWSADLLTEREPIVFRRLSVFVGGFTLEAAEAVGSGEGVDAGDVLDGLNALVDSSLVHQIEPRGDDNRFGLLRTIREYGLGELAISGELPTIRARHVAYFVREVEQAKRHWTGPEQKAWLARVSLEIDDLREALAYSLENDFTSNLRLVAGLWPFWRQRGHLTEGRQWLEAAIGHGQPATASPWAWSHLGAAILAYEQGDAEHGRALLDRAWTLFAEGDDQAGMAQTLLERAFHALLFDGDGTPIGGWLEESLSLAHRGGNQRTVGWALVSLGRLAAVAGDFGHASALIEDGIAVFRRIGDAGSVGGGLCSLGWVAILDGDVASAGHFLEESREIGRQLDDQHTTGLALLGLVVLARMAGNYPAMTTLLEECVPILSEVGSVATPVAFAFLGDLAVHQGAYTRGVRLFSAGSAARRPAGPIMSSVYSFVAATTADGLAKARAALDEGTFAGAWADGQAMPQAQALASGLRHDAR